MDTPFDMKLNEHDWDPTESAWRCVMLRIPEVEVESIYAGDDRLAVGSYGVDRNQRVIHWNSKSPQPKEIRLRVSLARTFVDSDVAARWGKAVVMLPVIVCLSLFLAVQFYPF